jgi:doublecortin-like kinase 1/2
MEVSVQSSNSTHSARSELGLEKNISDLDVSDKKNGLNGSININNLSSEKLNTLKKRISSSKTPNRTRETTKAKRVRFFRNGDKFWTGYLVAVSNERYK